LVLKLHRLGTDKFALAETVAVSAMSRAARDVRDYPPMLSLDSGGVLTQQGGRKDEKHDGNTIWKATVPGAYGLVLLHQHYHGRDSVGMVSRVNCIPRMAVTGWNAMPCLLDLTTTRCPLAVSAKGHQIACDFLKAALQSATKQRRLAAGLRGVE
jgi:hypothetical protein